MAKQLMSTTGSFVPDGLIAGDFDMVPEGIIIASGAGVLPRGSVLGMVTASKKHILSASAAVDGSQTVRCILAEAVDATAADVATVAYLTGEFTESALTLGAGHTLDSIRETLRGNSIFLKKSKAV